MNDNKTTGQRGEELAADWLLGKGYQILARNWRFRHWEVDIIAAKGRCLHFIEVKTRASLRYGRPEESITRDKMTCLKNIAEEYQYQHPEWQYVQFDVIAITITDDHLRELFVIEDVYF
ncbi:MAG: YraN family protein [Chitinophagaceae bacterium]|nr:YraN family protein [Chitinophagaceae bacterium]